MSLEMFFKQNAVQVENKKIEISKRFLDSEGNPIKFEIKAISSADDQILRENCTVVKEIPGKKGQFAPQLDVNKYTLLLAAACVVYPQLDNAALQDSYGVRTKTELLSNMLLPAELQDLNTEVQAINGFKTMTDLEEEAKN